MLVAELFESNEQHAKTLERTGFWGKAGAGCVIIARDTKRICMPKRSKDVEEPGTWGTWGGAIDGREAPKAAAEREVREEAGYDGQLELVPLFVFKKGSFKYHNFLAVVDTEFNPTLNWETSTYRWCSFDELPSPLHFGMQGILNDPDSVSKIEAV
jgi:8-oxo-dGTP pyrophosphatase MutT (NUDIX family)